MKNLIEDKGEFMKIKNSVVSSDLKIECLYNTVFVLAQDMNGKRIESINENDFISYEIRKEDIHSYITLRFVIEILARKGYVFGKNISLITVVVDNGTEQYIYQYGVDQKEWRLKQINTYKRIKS